MRASTYWASLVPSFLVLFPGHGRAVLTRAERSGIKSVKVARSLRKLKLIDKHVNHLYRFDYWRLQISKIFLALKISRS